MRKFLIVLVVIQSLCAVAEAKTYALIVGISEYPKLPHEQWLQYPKADAEGLAKRLAIPPDQLLLMTDGQATTAALRDAFKTFLSRPGKEDTVFIFIAGHGNVDASGAYILTSDSDTSDLKGTALPMGEVQQLVQSGLSNAGHVVFLADVCRAGMIGSIKLGGEIVAQLGDAPGELLGLMAARPRELSIEGPEYGGGHGAFTDSVLRGLGGAADEDHDGVITAGELIDYVTKDVPGKTRDKQHPREFGDMDNSTKLASVSK
jgi:uncharacterized caspase-like protein